MEFTIVDADPTKAKAGSGKWQELCEAVRKLEPGKAVHCTLSAKEIGCVRSAITRRRIPVSFRKQPDGSTLIFKVKAAQRMPVVDEVGRRHIPLRAEARTRGKASRARSY